MGTQTDYAFQHVLHSVSQLNDFNVRVEQDLVELAAKRLAPNGDTANVLTGIAQADDNVATPEEVDALLKDQRQRFLALAKANVEDEREWKTFKGAIQQLRQQPGPNNGEMVDYVTMLDELMKAQAQVNKGNQLEMEQEKYYRETCKILGVSLATDKKKRSDDDDEIEVMGNGSSTASLKCPLTMALYEEPVKSRVCNHIFSRAAIEAYIRSNRFNCPVPGCVNRQLTLNQLDADQQTAMLVNRARRREERETQQRMTQAIGSDSEEEMA